MTAATSGAGPGGNGGHRRWPLSRRGKIVASAAGVVVALAAVLAGVLATSAPAAPASRAASAPASPAASASDNDYLSDVSCASAGFCVAVGYYTSARHDRALIESWDGSRWSLAATPGMSDDNQLNSVSCASAGFCVAVGYYASARHDRALIESWDGSRWSLATALASSSDGNAVLSGVSCVSASFCAATGQQRSGTHPSRALIESWDGSRWSLMPSPTPAPSALVSLPHVSCVSRASCTATGEYVRSTSHVATVLVESWDGSRWSLASGPSPHGRDTGIPSGVSCVSSTSCTAVSRHVDSSGHYQTLAESWNGGRWSLAPGPDAGATDLLFGVSCARSGFCAAVGWWYQKTAGGVHTLTESWDGGRWSLTPSPNTTPTDTDALFGVSCARSDFCAAVGYYEHGPRSHVVSRTLIESWNGTGWSLAPSPNK